MKFILTFVLLSTTQIFAQGDQGDSYGNPYGRQCAEFTNGDQCTRHHTCREPQEGENRIIKCQCYKSWAALFSKQHQQSATDGSTGEYISVGTGSTDNEALESAKDICVYLLHQEFIPEYVENPNPADYSEYQVEEKYCSPSFICEPEN